MGYIGFLVAIDLFLNLLEASILNYDMGINLTLAVVLLHLWIFGGILLFLRCGPCSCCNKCINETEEEEELVVEGKDADDTNNDDNA